MQNEIKINLNYKRFFALSILTNIILGALFLRTQTEFWVMLFNYWAILGYLVFLVKGGQGLAEKRISGAAAKGSTPGIVFMFLGKIFIIFGALSLSVHFIGNKILVPLLNYIFHIFILGYALRGPLKDHQGLKNEEQ